MNTEYKGLKMKKNKSKMFRSLEVWKFRSLKSLNCLAAKKFIPSLGGGLGRGLRLIGKHLAFSLIELMISLIAISVITAAFTPVIS
ncbi:prepilin-type N-terminal cleavage/methylation domain-containing protein, partial [bacterium]|nr:prepilin-type N-terminal cleavage/methylation domain-containing protein [bacterium]